MSTPTGPAADSPHLGEAFTDGAPSSGIFAGDMSTGEVRTGHAVGTDIGTPRSIVPPYVDPLSQPPRSIIVIGAGLAGMRTCIELRNRGFTGAIDLVGSERMAPYDRPPLTKELFDRRAPLWLEEEYQPLADLGVVTHLGMQAEHLYADDSSVAVTIRTPGRASTVLTGDAVVLATGARPWTPPDWDGAVTLRTWNDAEHLRQDLTPESKVVIIGAGWIGCELASAATQVGCQVTVIEAGHGPLPTLCTTEISERVGAWFTRAGVHLISRTPVVAVNENTTDLSAHRMLVTTETGNVLRADVVVAALGARPDNAWLIGNDAGIAVFGDDHPSASLPLKVGLDHSVIGAPRTVRAVGDCASRWSPRFGFVPSGHWDEALRGPERVAAGLLGVDLARAVDDEVYAAHIGLDLDPTPYVFSTMFGHDLSLFGLVPDPADVVVHDVPADPADEGTRPPGEEPWYAEWTRWSGLESEIDVDTIDRVYGSTVDDTVPADEDTVRNHPATDGNRPAVNLSAVMTVDQPKLTARVRAAFRGRSLPVRES